MSKSAEAVEYLCKEAADCFTRIDNLTDLEITTSDGMTLTTSKAVLALFSKFFGNMFKDLAADTRRITVTERSAEFSGLLDFIHAQGKYDITAGNINQSLALAGKYDVPRLTEACDAYLCGVTLDDATLPDWINAATIYHCDAFLKRCEKYAAKKLQCIISSRVQAGKLATDWMETLTQASLVDIIRVRSSVICGLARKHYSPGRDGYYRHQASSHSPSGRPLTDCELEKLELGLE